jgi:hypothetical protein
MRPVGEKAKAVVVCVDRKKTGFLFLEHVVVSPRSQKVGTVPGSLGQDLDDPLHFRGRNADLIGRAAASFALGAAVASVLEQQERRDVDFHTAALMLRWPLLTAIFRSLRSHGHKTWSWPVMPGYGASLLFILLFTYFSLSVSFVEHVQRRVRRSPAVTSGAR